MSARYNDARFAPLAMVPLIAILFGLSTAMSGILFRTYGLGLTDPGLEAARQLGLPFVAGELVVILIAFRRGMRITHVLAGLPAVARALLAIFIATFWIGALQSRLGAIAMAFNVITLVHLLFLAAVVHCSRDIEDGDGIWSTRAFTLVTASTVLMAGGAVLFAPDPSSVPGGIQWLGAIPGFISLRLFGAFGAAMLGYGLLNALIAPRAARERWIDHLLIAMSCGIIVWSGTRAAVLAVAVALVIAFALRPMWPTPRRLLAIAFSLACGAGIAILLQPDLEPFQLIRFGQATGQQEMLSGRSSLWHHSIALVVQHPWFGLGPAATAWALPASEFPHVQPHNVVIQFLLFWGVPAGLSALALLAMLVVRVHRLASRYVGALPLLALADTQLVIACLDGTLHFASCIMLVFMALGAVAAYGRAPSFAMRCGRPSIA